MYEIRKIDCEIEFKYISAFQMSDVAQGGATVFTKLNVGAWPKKGSAVFWHNLHATGERDYRTLHAGCPVLLGNKWGETIYTQF
jgi:prolyl 4-hydroxylase